MPRVKHRGKYQLREGIEVLATARFTREEVEARNEVGAGYVEKGQEWKPAMVTGVARGRYPKALWRVGE